MSEALRIAHITTYCALLVGMIGTLGAIAAAVIAAAAAMSTPVVIFSCGLMLVLGVGILCLAQELWSLLR